MLGLFALGSERLSWPACGAALLVQTFLYTGLFIVAHDALHGSIAPGRPHINDAIGALCAWLYASFSFERLRAEHRRHHAHPGTADDPDFHDGRHPGFVRWYVHFFRSYFSVWQILANTVAFQLWYRVAGIPVEDLIGFWVVPSLLSTLQLFFFGTFLPHREPPGGHVDGHRARSNDLPEWASFLTCYHFGYHWEHHAYPQLPWWRLPAARRAAESWRVVEEES